MTKEETKLQFMDDHEKTIIQETLRYLPKKGFLQVYVKEDFTIQFFQFQNKRFQEKSFSLLDDLKEGPNFFIYYEVLWTCDQTKWKIKKQIFLPPSDPKSLPN